MQQARAAYQPKLPKGLKGFVKVKEGALTESVDNQEEIKALFPNTYGMPLIEFEQSDVANQAKMNVGVILSGGQAPGGHNVITGLLTLSRDLILRTSSTASSWVLADLLTITIWKLLPTSLRTTAILAVST